MRRMCTFLLLCLLFSGCAGHYQKLEGDTVKLFLRAPDAREVLFASSLDGYRPRPAQRVNGSTWVVGMPAGREFSYFYLIDGHVFVPECPCREGDDFGSDNCVHVPAL